MRVKENKEIVFSNGEILTALVQILNEPGILPLDPLAVELCKGRLKKAFALVAPPDDKEINKMLAMVELHDTLASFMQKDGRPHPIVTRYAVALELAKYVVATGVDDEVENG